MPEQNIAIEAVDIIAVLWQVLPQLITYGAMIGTVIAFGGKIKGWIVKDLFDEKKIDDYLFNSDDGKITVILRSLLTKEWIEDYLFHIDSGKLVVFKGDVEQEVEEIKKLVDDKVNAVKQHAAEQLKNHKERSDEKDRADKDWLRGLQERVEKLQIKVGE